MEYNVFTGMSCEIERNVTDEDTALKMGSGELKVLATPVMVAWMENAALNAVKSSLPQGCGTVGVSVNITHDAATPVGMKVRVIAEVTEVEGRMVTFKVKAYDEKDKIGQGTHKRCIIDEEKFMKKADAKK